MSCATGSFRRKRRAYNKARVPRADSYFSRLNRLRRVASGFLGSPAGTGPVTQGTLSMDELPDPQQAQSVEALAEISEIAGQSDE